jgi:hypothetical protein
MVAAQQQYPRTDFPADLECHPLLVVDFERITAGDEKEIDTLYTACTQLGFFYLKNFGFEDVIEPMFEMGKATFDLTPEELEPFEQGALPLASFLFHLTDPYLLLQATAECRQATRRRARTTSMLRSALFFLSSLPPSSPH